MILASKSPRRLEILENHHVHPIVLPSDADESVPRDMSPSDLAMFLALKKALSVEEKVLSPIYLDDHPEVRQHLQEPGCVLLSADTIVAKGHMVFGKPVDLEDARFITGSLQDSVHLVITGCCLLVPGTTKRRVFYESTKVYMDPISKDELEAYIRTDEPYDKAGGYAIQGTFSKYIKKIEGDLENVIGLPYEKVMAEISLL